MIEHEFMQGGAITEVDLRTILDLTAVGTLEWGTAHEAAAIGTNVAYSVDQASAERANLLEVRAGFVPKNDEITEDLNYLRLTDRDHQHHYVEEGDNDALIPLAQRVLHVGFIAVRSSHGRLSGIIAECPTGDHESGQIEVYRAVHGIPGAVLSGTERVECVSCGHRERVAA